MRRNYTVLTVKDLNRTQIIVLPFFIVLQLVMNRHRISEVGVRLFVELVNRQSILQVEAERTERIEDKHLKCGNPQHSIFSNHRLIISSKFSIA